MKREGEGREKKKRSGEGEEGFHLPLRYNVSIVYYIICAICVMVQGYTCTENGIALLF